MMLPAFDGLRRISRYEQQKEHVLAFPPSWRAVLRSPTPALEQHMDQPHSSTSIGTSDPSGSASFPLDDDRVEQILIQVARLARTFAAEAMWRERKENAEDVADEIVLECLVAMREGRWDVRDDGLGGFIRTIVERRASDFRRGRQRRGTRERAHTRELEKGARAWMSPELGYEEKELRALQDRVLALIPVVCRRAYLMVRDAQMSYEDVAVHMGVSRSAVTSYVVRAQRRFRQELERQGIQGRYRNGRPAPSQRDSLGWRPGPERRGL